MQNVDSLLLHSPVMCQAQFLAFFSCQEKIEKKLAVKQQRKKKGSGPKNTIKKKKKNCHILHCSFSLKKKKKHSTLAFLAKVRESYYHSMLGYVATELEGKKCPL